MASIITLWAKFEKKIPFRENKNKCSTIFTSASNDANTLTQMFNYIFFPFVAQCVTASTSIACNDNNNEHTLHL